MKKEVAQELRKSAGIIASAHYGKEIRNAMSNSLETLASFIEEEELPSLFVLMLHAVKENKRVNAIRIETNFFIVNISFSTFYVLLLKVNIVQSLNFIKTLNV